MKQYSTWQIDVDMLADMGWDLSLMSITASKGRPFMVVASNAKMVWLVPMTTQVGGRFGRVTCVHDRFGKRNHSDAITTDMFPVHRDVFARVAKRFGQVVDGGADVSAQLGFSVSSGTLGRAPSV